MNNSAFLGIVQDERFKPLASDHAVTGSFRLTGVAVPSAATPESEEISLTEYEGSAIIVRGVESGEWIYSAIVLERAGLILTAVVQKVFGPTFKEGGSRLQYPWA